MVRSPSSYALGLWLLHLSLAHGQVEISGRLAQARFPGSAERMPLTAVVAFATRESPQAESLSFRTWETEPAGWYRLIGREGRYTVLFTGPSHFVRPMLLTNVFTRNGDNLRLAPQPRFDHAILDERAFDNKPAHEYLQKFVARSTSLTHVGFRLAHDGVDGAGPGSQILLASVHRPGAGAPDTWEQIGPTGIVEVDCGGPKNPIWFVGWQSGEVPLVPGQTYALRLRAEKSGQAFQAYWQTEGVGDADCHRLGKQGDNGWLKKRLWLTLSGDGDDLLLPYTKRVQRPFGELTRYGPRWVQTYVAQGHALAGVVLYAATSGSQPPIYRQRVRVSVRQGGADGPAVGLSRVAVGNGNWTGDASWGMFGVAFAPGDVPLIPGQKYALVWESLENYDTLHGFVNIKGQVSNDRPGFNPYRKQPRDDYPAGTAYFEGKDVGYDLDAQVLEYQQRSTRWELARQGRELVQNGDLNRGQWLPDRPETSEPQAWKRYRTHPQTDLLYTTEGADARNRVLGVAAVADKGVADGGFFQFIGGLSAAETYRLSVRVRSTHVLDDNHSTRVGLDATGQTDNPLAETIRWTILPEHHGVFEEHLSLPIRPRKDAVSVWLHGRRSRPDRFPFRADFDDVSLRRVATSPPSSTPERSGSTKSNR